MGTLRITVDHSVRIAASSARVQVRVSGSSTLAAGVAGRKAALVRDIVAELAAKGVAEEAVEVAGVRSSVRDGALLKNQTIEIDLVVSTEPELLPEVLGVLADRPGVSVTRLDWVYDDFEASIGATATAMAMARRKADAVAASVGLEVIGVEQASDSWSMPSPRHDQAEPVLFAASARSASAPLDLGLELRATTELSVHLSVDFALSS